MNTPFISICIPNYNRPDELYRLLKTIDSAHAGEIEIVICDDKSPRVDAVKEKVNMFMREAAYSVVFKENSENLGFDKNLRALIEAASGRWIVYMGNDDEFVPGAIDKLYDFLRAHTELGYVLRSFYFFHKNGKKEKFRYYPGNTFFAPGEAAYVTLFRKSVFISGFTFRRELAKDLLIDNLDGTLLYQLYLVGEICLAHPSAYFDEPLTQYYDEGVPEFGNAKSEKGITPGVITIENSVKFMQGFFTVTKFIDRKHALQSTAAIKKDMSKYLYPALAIQRDKGIGVFIAYVRRLNAIGFNITIYYYLYVVGLVILGKRACDAIIRILKDMLGKTPKL